MGLFTTKVMKIKCKVKVDLLLYYILCVFWFYKFLDDEYIEHISVTETAHLVVVQDSYCSFQ